MTYPLLGGRQPKANIEDRSAITVDGRLTPVSPQTIYRYGQLRKRDQRGVDGVAVPASGVVVVMPAGVEPGDDGFRGTGEVHPQLARQLAERVRNRGAVLLAAGTWPDADLELRVSNPRWRGLTDDGFGHLEFPNVIVTSRGRGAAARPRNVALQLSGPGGAVASGEQAQASVLGAQVCR